MLRASPAATGHLHFSMVALMQDRDAIATRLQQGPYAQPALAPATPWLDATLPAPPVLRALGGGWLKAHAAPGKPPFVWAVWRRQRGSWRFAVQPAADDLVDAGAGTDLLAVSAVCRVGQASAATPWRVR